ncbi:MAG TPA: glutathione S-transferase family protein [Burkholderiales bacterium]|jgi:glutathione S-transferase|nr:glutathione S-transferase family protein [Burkholderiales bacterium]
MTEAASQPVLHHYPVSPFAEKARLMLGYKRLAWKSVQIPLIMPKPDVVALTGGYRRTPILQLGADIYCDTALIARVLERLAPAPSFFPQGDTYAQQAAAHFADTTLFWNTVPVGFTPGTGMMKKFFKDAAPEYLAAFGKDRSGFRGGSRRGPAHECKANLMGLLPRIEAQFSAPYLFGAAPCYADFSLYHALWPLWLPEDLRPMIAAHPRTLAFMERMSAIGHGKPSEISSAEALRLASASKPEPVKGAVALETNGIALGAQAAVMPIDTGLDPVVGELLNASADAFVLRRTDARAGTVHVHFPRFGFQINKPA